MKRLVFALVILFASSNSFAWNPKTDKVGPLLPMLPDGSVMWPQLSPSRVPYLLQYKKKAEVEGSDIRISDSETKGGPVEDKIVTGALDEGATEAGRAL